MGDQSQHPRQHTRVEIMRSCIVYVLGSVYTEWWLLRWGRGESRWPFIIFQCHLDRTRVHRSLELRVLRCLAPTNPTRHVAYVVSLFFYFYFFLMFVTLEI